MFLKDPAATIYYAVDWQAAYLNGQTIAASQWTIVPDAAGGMTVADAGHTAGRTAVTLGGGQRGAIYRLTNRVTLSDGRSDERSLDVRVEDR